jgi:hypothetical protein
LPVASELAMLIAPTRAPFRRVATRRQEQNLDASSVLKRGVCRVPVVRED